MNIVYENRIRRTYRRRMTRRERLVGVACFLVIILLTALSDARGTAAERARILDERSVMSIYY